MKKRIQCLIMLLSIFMAAKANPVDETQAREVGYKFLNATQKMNVKNTDALRLVKTYRCETGEAAFYVFNTDTGYVIVSADDCATPILGYSYEGPFDLENVPVQMQDYLNEFLEQIEYGVVNHIAANEIIAAQWERVKTTGRIKDGRDDREVLPLLKEKWNQRCGYNYYCPEDTTSNACGHAVTGCVATAMAQIMHYWKYPETGQGSHSYIPLSHPEYGEQFVDFSATTYDWDNMPNWFNSNSSETEIDAVATLMWHCGVSVDMNYGPFTSSAYSSKVGPALVNHFKYSNELVGKSIGEDHASWLASIKECLDLKRPLYYSGSTSSKMGHAFVCDGYDRNDLLHFNWGLVNNGYCALEALPWHLYNYAIFNIHPPYDPNHSCMINVTTDPFEAGSVTGDGLYPYGEICTLTAHASDGFRFQAWKENDVIISIDSVYTFLVLENCHLQACFESTIWSTKVDVDCSLDSVLFSQSANLTWKNDSLGDVNINEPWPLLCSFDLPSSNMSGVATDGRFIYFSTWNYTTDTLFYRYDLSGKLIDTIKVKDCGNLYNLAYDGRYLYGGTLGGKMCCVDLDNDSLVNVISTSCRYVNGCTYDPIQDGFWVSDNKKLKLINRDGQLITEGPYLDSCLSVAFYRNEIGDPHLFLLCWHENIYNNDHNSARIYDYDINSGELGHELLCDLSNSLGYSIGECTSGGAFVGEYMGRAALFCFFHLKYMAIYELPLNVSEVRYYRVYRVSGTIDNEYAIANRELIADWNYGASYTDQDWDSLPSGIYTYGVSLLRGGEESEISWSEPVEHKKRYIINARANMQQGGIVAGHGWLEEGSVCVLTATADADYAFVEWTKNDSVVSTDPVYSFTVTEDAEYVANFEKVVFEIGAFANPENAGEVTGAGTYNKGETVVLTVTPKPNYRFSQWVENGLFLSSETTYSFVATKDRIIYANLAYNHGVDEHGQQVLSLHPNPVDDHLVVECSQPVRRCEIFSVSGALVYSLDEVNESSVEIGLDNLSSGLYMIHVTTDGSSIMEKFVKQ